MTTLKGKNELVEVEIPGSTTVQCEAFKKLVVYDVAVPGTISGINPLYYASVFDPSVYTELLSDRGKYTVMRRVRKDAFRILKLLTTFVHPNILMPVGDWETYIPIDPVPKVPNDPVPEVPNDSVPKKPNIVPEVLITFQEVHGSLIELPKTELFIVELPSVQEQGANIMHLQGFSQNGLKVWSDLIGAVEHVNENYRTLPAGTLLLPLQLTADRILYQNIPMGKYHVLLGDFHTRIEDYPGLGLPDMGAPGLEDIKRANWRGLGTYLRTLVGENNVASPEIDQLINVLEGLTTTLDDIMWEPALWDPSTRMSFFRIVVTCVNTDRTKKAYLISKPTLGLQACIDKLIGESFKEKNLLGSVTFLRNKLAAHYDEPYCVYSGCKEEIGLDKATIGKFLLKEKPDYMINLIKEIRPLGWIAKSPLTHHADYKQLVKKRDST